MPLDLNENSNLNHNHKHHLNSKKHQCNEAKLSKVVGEFRSWMHNVQSVNMEIEHPVDHLSQQEVGIEHSDCDQIQHDLPTSNIVSGNRNYFIGNDSFTSSILPINER